MTQIRLVRSFALLAVGTVLLGACTLYRTRGEGPVSRDRVAHMLEDSDPDALRTRVDILEARLDAEEETKNGMRTLNGDSGFTWPLLAGTWEMDEYHVPAAFDPERDREFVSEVRVGGLLAPIVYGHVITSFDDVETGRRVASVRTGGLPLLYLRHKQATPVGFEQAPDRRLLDKRYPLEGAPYEYENSTNLLMGIIGWGERNRCVFMKLLFFEIPLWAED